MVFPPRVKTSAVTRVRLFVELADGGTVELEGNPQHGVQMSLEPRYSGGPVPFVTSVGLHLDAEVDEVRYVATPPTSWQAALTSGDDA